MDEMILLADSGSTKTEWVILTAKGIAHRFRSEGFNPSTQSENYIRDVLQQQVLPELKEESIKAGNLGLRFFTAGAGKEVHRRKMETLLLEVLPVATQDVMVGHDMQAAGIALFGLGAGIGCIIGTGANAAVCKGGYIHLGVPSGGYLLGDEGSGNHLGKRLAADYLYGFLPEGDDRAFEDHFGMDADTLWHKVYFEPNPNRFLASLAPFIYERKHIPYYQRMVTDTFQSFFSRILVHLHAYRELPLGVIGSVGMAFQEAFTERADVHGYGTPHFVQAPMEGMVAFYQKQLQEHE